MPITRLMPAAEFAVPVPALSAPGGAASDDGRALHELLFAGGDIARPRPWCAEPTGWLVAASVEVVEGRLPQRRRVRLSGSSTMARAPASPRSS